MQNALAQAIGYAVQHKVSVISMSLGYGEPSAVVRAALQNALDHGVVVVASSGNSGESVGARASGQAPYSFPADYPGVLGVAAVSRSGAAAGFSSDNLSVQVAAPGVNVPAQGRDGQYWLVSGTSPACALTAGVAALIKARYPGLAPALVVRAITDSTRHRPPGGYDDKVGFGTVDAAAALTAAGRLAGHLRPAAGLPVSTCFGGGSAAVPAVPVRPRGATGLITACLAGLGCLALAGLAGAGLATLRRAGSRGQHAAPRPGRPRPPGPARGCRPAGRTPRSQADPRSRPAGPGDAARFRQPGAGCCRPDPAGPGDVLRRCGRVPGPGRPAPGRPGDGAVGRQRAVVAGGARGRVAAPRARAGGAGRLPGGGHPAAGVPDRGAAARRYASGPLGWPGPGTG